MSKSRFSEARIRAILGEDEAGMSGWRPGTPPMSVRALERVKELEAENSRLEKIYATLALEISAEATPPEAARSGRGIRRRTCAPRSNQGPAGP